MAFNINKVGSISDALAVYRDDIYDTLKNIGNCTDAYATLLMNVEDSDFAIDETVFPINLVYKNENISIKKTDDTYHLYNGLGEDKGTLIDLVNHEISDILGYNAYDILSSCSADYTSNELLLEACDLALSNDDPDADISAMLGAKYGPQAASLSSAAKESLDNIQTYLQHSNRGPTGVAGFISELYASIADTQVDETGHYYSSSDKPWRISGFVGGYAVRSAVRLATNVISAVVTVVAPIIGIAISVLFGALSKIADMFMDFTSSQVKVNPKVTNNMLNMSLFDYDVDQYSLPLSVQTYFSNNPEAKSVQYRMTGCTWIFTRPGSNGKFHLQIMANIEYTSISNYTVGSYNLSDHSYTTVPFNGSGWTDGWKGYFYSQIKAYNTYTTVNADRATQDMYDGQARESVMCTYSMLFGLMAANSLGSGVTTVVLTSRPTDGNLAQNAYWLSSHRSNSESANTWANIVALRNMYRNVSQLGVELCDMFYRLTNYDQSAIPADTFCISRRLSFPWISTFYMEVPSYTSGAVWRSLLLAAGVAAVTIASAVVIQKVKRRIQKFTARRQLDVEAKRYAYENAAPQDKDAAFNDYWKSMRSFNKWTVLTGYDKIDLTTGYMASENSSDISSGYGINAIKQVKNVSGDYQTVDLTTIYKLIAGS